MTRDRFFAPEPRSLSPATAGARAEASEDRGVRGGGVARRAALTLVLGAALVVGCGGSTPLEARSSKEVAPGGAEAGPPRLPLVFLDDAERGFDRARAEGKLVFVDAWAPWCHTCLSMKHYVLGDPSLRPLADRLVFVALDTDKPESAPFLERHAMTVWPTFFVLDPGTGAVYGSWPGAASARELRDFVDESLRIAEQERGGSRDATLSLLADARRAHAKRAWADAAAAYERVAAASKGSRRSEALLGWIQVLSAAKSWPACADLGARYANQIEGAAVPADFAGFALSCAEKLPAGQAQSATRQAAVARLRALTSSPPPEASADDRADALSYLAEGLDALGDAAGARAARERALAILEKAASAAPTKSAASTYDYARAGMYVALGRADEAVRMLVAREKELPESYEPPARLAEVLLKIGRYPEALEAIQRAIERAYGPRKMRYLKVRAEIFAKMGDSPSQIATLREEVRGWESVAQGHANEERLADARRRLDDAVAAAPRKP